MAWALIMVGVGCEAGSDRSSSRRRVVVEVFHVRTFLESRLTVVHSAFSYDALAQYISASVECESKDEYYFKATLGDKRFIEISVTTMMFCAVLC